MPFLMAESTPSDEDPTISEMLYVWSAIGAPHDRS
jgi:hypothetical protein